MTQVLKGLQLVPKGPQNIQRFGQYLVNGAFPESFAFGGWIFNTSCEIGFSDRPTEIQLSIVLETPSHSQQYTTFDIQPEDLNCSAGNGGHDNENTWDLNFNGIWFYDFILYDYEISIQESEKILNVTFYDYSIILSKIYVGLIQRQGTAFVRQSIENVSYPISCFTCQYTGYFPATGVITRELNYGSYVGINGNTYDNFASVPYNSGIYTQWSQLFALQPTPYNVQFDLNGGYLIIGNEEAAEELCGNVVPVGYNFNELLASLRVRGMNFIGAFPYSQTDRDFIYKQNYVGTLRTVLNQWCSDLSYDFYTSGKNFIGIDLNVPIDISNITSIADPTTPLGFQFALNKNSAIVSYKQKNTLENTWRQGVITTNNRAEDSKIASKTNYRYVGMLPMHPLDFNYPNNNPVQRTDVFGNPYPDAKLANSFLQNSGNYINYDITQRCDRLDNRTFDDIDTSIALTRYSPELRDIYCQQRAYNSLPTTNYTGIGFSSDANANFLALGMLPLVEITGDSDKSFAIQWVVGGINPDSDSQDEISNVCLDQQYYRVFIGYYYEQFKEKITQWEANAAENMYKYGAIKQGLIQGPPYIPYDTLQDASPGYGLNAGGLSGLNGTQLIRITNKTNPASYQYYGWNYLPVPFMPNLPYLPNRQSLVEAPFRDILLYSGIGSIYDPELYIGELNMNDWGTSVEGFNRSLSLQLIDACQQSFAQEPSYVALNLGYDSKDNKMQDWNLGLFTPKASADLKNFFGIYSDYFDMLSGQGTLDRLVKNYYDLQYTQAQTCSKLHIIVLTDTINHPNISVSFNKTNIQYINGAVLRKYNEQMENWIIQRELTPTINICEKPLILQLCENVLYNDYLQQPKNPSFGCAIENPYDLYLPGFSAEFVSNPNSRGLQISITRNPVQNNPSDLLNLYQGTDAQGEIYYSNVLSNSFITLPPQQGNLTIVYPASIEASSNSYYNCALTTNTSIDNRSPAINEVYGNPPNISNNNASTIKIINNFVMPPLQPYLDQQANRFLPIITILTGGANAITTISGYANYLQNINNYQNTGCQKSVSLVLAGTPDYFGSFANYLYPTNGLIKFDISVGDKGVQTSLEFRDRPPILPKQESVLNSIISRLS